MEQFHYQKDAQNIVTLTMDMAGPVNTMNASYLELMQAAISRLSEEDALKGVVIASAKKTFFAGGDLKYMSGIEAGQESEAFAFTESIKAQLRALEKLPVPVVAAINGAALGGGFELCLACHHRIAAPSALVGLPEVQLGLLPGGGGIVRTVNLLGVQAALPLLLEGKKQIAKKAFELGLIDELLDDALLSKEAVNAGAEVDAVLGNATTQALVAQAKQWIIEQANNPFAAIQPWDWDKRQHGKVHKLPGGDMNQPKNALFVAGISAKTFQKTRGLMPAPEQIIDMAAEAARLPFDRAMTLESRKLAYLITTPQAKNLIQTFFFQMNAVKQGASRPNIDTRSSVKKLGIIGAGMMGQGIAFSAAQAGIETVLMDVTLDKAQAGKLYSEARIQKQVEKGRVTEEQASALLGLITPTDDEQALSGCDFIVEAVFEDKVLKHEMTQRLEPLLAEGGVWGSNTSTLPISLLAQASTQASHFIGIHFFSPADKMPLVEIICGEQTSDETLAKTFDLVQQLGKTPIVVKDKVGFYTSRTFEAQLTEASQLIAEGVHPVRIDNLGVALGMPVGPLTMMDEVSLKLLDHIRQTQLALGLRSANNEPTPQGLAVNDFVFKQHQRGGKQYGGGFYDHDEDGKNIWGGLQAEFYNPDVQISDDDIKDRLLFRNVIEALHCLEEGVVTSVADANIGSILGIGAPAWTGGYIQYVNTYGLTRFIQRCEQLTERYGARFSAPQIVREYAQTGRTFS